MVIEKKPVTAEELLQLPDNGLRYELIAGELREMTPPGGPHGLIQARIARLFANFVEEQGLGYLVGVESGVILRRHPDTVRSPDVYVIARERLPAGTLADGYLQVVPNLIVEIVSPGDRASDVQEKAQDWLDAGARLVLVVYPRSRTVFAWRGSDSIRQYRPGEELDAEPVLPGFRCPVARLFD